MMEDPLEVEARTIHRAIFAADIPAHVGMAYRESLRRLPLLPNPLTDPRILASPRRLADAEFALRLLRGRNGLTQRFQAMLYLGEVEPGVQPRFSRASASLAGGLLDATVAVVSAALALVRGWWAIRRLPRA